MSRTVYVIDINWNVGKRRWGNMLVAPTREDCLRYMRDALWIIGQARADDIIAYDIQRNNNGGTLATFTAGGRDWQYHLYPETEGANKIRKFQP